MPSVHLHALLPARDGTGWYAMTTGRDAPHRCSDKGCAEDAIAYHHAVHAGQKRIWRNSYRCAEHLPLGMLVQGGRVWFSRGNRVEQPISPG